MRCNVNSGDAHLHLLLKGLGRCLDELLVIFK